MDSLDQQIIAMLRANARASVATLVRASRRNNDNNC